MRVAAAVSWVISNSGRIDSLAPYSINSLIGFFPSLRGELVGEASVPDSLAGDQLVSSE